MGEFLPNAAPFNSAGMLDESDVRAMLHSAANIDPDSVNWPEPSAIDPATHRRFWTTTRVAAFLRTVTHGRVGLSFGKTSLR